ncbi:hypothetical protein H072_529 [Dactylellina haptotyla CBS 200.50]|uniref:ubiquitinyl hydrolase 1 n=1 Tax=Dactylellina haptotyla (strain CBS 200.50) TaxID=1284197 RepID=S8ARK3_DACHA|nr:hypothetical protein H072_529 [Dactylellina haptotyla CBS 200.50]
MLLDINYNIHRALSKALAPIEASDYIVATFDHGSGLIDINLPRYDVQFFINSDNKIESRTLRNWRIDENQGMGTFLGLENFLKLKNDTIGSGRESILVPFGRIKTRTASSEVPSNISIDPGEENRSYTIFNIDRVLNRVLDDGSLKARYTRLYLHAVSSGILPDPLTGRTGIEEALDGLQNAASFSFQNLESDEMLILNQIASLAPRRDFYPSHLREMQATQWKDNLPTWVQNEQFYYLVKDISKDWKSRQFLIEGSKEHELTPIGSEELLQRARNRHSAFYSGDPFYWHRTRSSSTHSLRHDIGKSETLVQNMAKSSFEWSSSQDLKSDFSEFFENSSRLAGGNNSFELTYCPEWVDIDPVTEWCSLYELCRTWPSRNCQARFPLLFILSFYVYRDELNQNLLKSLLAVAASGSFSSFRVPPYDFFQPNLGDKPTQAYVRSTLANHTVSFRESTYIDLSRHFNECDDDYYDRRRADYDAALKRQLDTATDSLIAQWPTMRPKISLTLDTSLLKSTLSMPRIVDRFEACYKNVKLFQHFSSVDSTLRQLHSYDLELKSFDITTLSTTISAPHVQTRRARRLKCNTAFSLSSLINRRSPPEDHDVRPELSFASNPTGTGSSLKIGIETVKSIANRLCKSNEDFAHKYANDLLDSVNALSYSDSPETWEEMVATTEVLDRYQADTQANVEGIYNKISGALSPISKSEESLWFAGLWPTISKIDILQQLRLSNRGGLTTEWTKAMVDLGKAITWQQRAERLSQLHRDSLKQEFQREAQNEGRQNWDANECLDWLLLEIDSGMMIRPVQAEIGLKMMDDTENQNAVMQLNMGEGKSAIILPAAVAALADSRKLVRSIVLKPLATQMFQILVQRLSGICNRKIYFLPFSRGLSLSVSSVEAIRALYQKCMEEGSILLTLPEHLLSFKLMGWEKTINGNITLSKPLLNTQNWLDKHTRDVLDESDEILHIRYQLIYTMGQQHTLEGNSDRWTTIQELLDLLQARVNDWLAREPRAVEVISMDAPRFPHVRIIDKSKGSEFLNELAKEICLDNDDSVPSISSKLKLLDPKQRELAFRFISAKDISVEEQDKLLTACSSLKTQLLVLRGLIAYGVLLFLLRDKRYRVDYGLDLISRRSKLAVPYRAKDQPAVKAEFGHPEVVLTLTCLTYYYGGLEDAELQSCFDILFKTDDPDLTYERWTKRHPNTPISLSKLQGLNFLDQGQVAQIYNFFRFNKDVIDFFLSELVFPREAKGFPHKLSTSGWDIAESKRNNTTGFSGTNDNRHLLPTSIKQLDLPQQLHTNSLVLTNILREENNTIIKAQSSKDKAVEILTLTVEQSPKIQVLLDVGAAILELNNKQVAAKWLELENPSHIEGAVFFGQDDELLVMRRDKKIESFRTSALSQQLDKVLVYLDEAHTRGTDLKLPVGTRAIVTLGPNLAKDKFVQGCMRMRKLGKGHTLAFISSPDIYAQIQKEARKSEAQEVNVSDVLLWTMLESCRQIQHGFSTWADQGFKYQRRRAAKSVFSHNKNKLKLEKGILEVESRPLIKMYGVRDGEDDAQDEEEEDEDEDEDEDVEEADEKDIEEDDEEDGEEDDEECDEKDAEGELSPDVHAQTIQNRLDEFNIKQSTSIGVQEEQEREVNHEVEEERSIERPLPATALKHTLHPAVSQLVQTGNFEPNPTVFKRAFNIFAQTSCRNLLEISAWSSDLYVTKDFAETVERRPGESIDDYLRPVRWIVYTGEGGPLVIISPWEANQLMPKFRDSKVSRLHCYAPKVSRNMQTFEFLDFCPVPSAEKYDLEFMMDSDIRIQLNTFAGQLFFNDMQYYQDLQRFLGMSSINISEELKRGNDGWMSKSDFEEFARRILAMAGQTGSFSRNPAPFLAEITRMRRKGQGFSSTHLGMLLNTRILKAKDFE